MRIFSDDYSPYGKFSNQTLYGSYAIIIATVMISLYFILIEKNPIIGMACWVGYAFAFLFMKICHMKQTRELFGPNQRWKDGTEFDPRRFGKFER